VQLTMPTDSDSYTFRILSATDRTTGLAVPFTPTPSSAGTHNATFTQLHGTPIGVLYNGSGEVISAVKLAVQPVEFTVSCNTYNTPIGVPE